jgi:hypothetical protein
MTTKHPPTTAPQLASFTSRKVTGLVGTPHEAVPDSLTAWMTCYLTFAIVGVRSPAVAEKIALHLDLSGAMIAGTSAATRFASASVAIPSAPIGRCGPYTSTAPSGTSARSVSFTKAA